jgi:flagellar motor switch protein FliM
MSKILSQDEINALLQGVADGAVPTGEGGAAVGVRTIDLASQERDLRGRLPGLELVVDRFLRALGASLGGFFGQQPAVTLGGLEQIKFGRVTARLTPPVCLQLFRLAPLRGQGMLLLTPPLAAALLHTAFGGAPGRMTALAEREFSAIEQRVLERFGTQVLQDLQEAWRPIVALELGALRWEPNPLFAAIVPASDVVLLLDVRVEVGETPDALVSVVIPDAALDPIRPRLQVSGPEGESAAGVWRERIAELLGGAELELAAELGTRRMRLREVLALRAGDVLALGTGREGPVLVRVEGRPRFLGTPGMSGGSNAVRVTARL